MATYWQLQLRHFAQKRLTTTVEEDSSNREYFDEVKVRRVCTNECTMLSIGRTFWCVLTCDHDVTPQEREERAVSEKIQLEQKLKLQRVELQKQANQIQTSEDKTRAELHELQVGDSEAEALFIRASKNFLADP